MRVVLLLLVVARVAAASPFTLRMPASDALSVVETSGTLPPTENVRDVMAADPALAGVKLERLSRVHTAVAYIAVPALPHRVHGRALIAAVDALARDGTFVTLRFYVDSMDHAAHWATAARDAASTLVVHIEPSAPRSELPTDWERRSDFWTTRLVTAHGDCKAIVGELDARPSQRGDVRHVPGEVRGDLVYWSVWGDNAGQHAELITGGGRWGVFHVLCRARSAGELEEQRKAIEAELR